MSDEEKEYEPAYDPEPDDPAWAARSKSHADYVDRRYEDMLNRQRWRDDRRG